MSAREAEDVREALAVLVKQVSQKFGGPSMAEFANDPPIRKHYATADSILAAFEVRPRGPVTDAEVEAAAKAMFEDGTGLPGDYTWAQMVAEDSTRADIWRADARRVLEAAREVRP